EACLLRPPEIAKREIGARAIARHLLAQRMQHGNRLGARVVCVELDIVAETVRWPDADHAICREPLLVNELLQHGSRIVIEIARSLSVFVVIEDARKSSLQLPSMEE